MQGTMRREGRFQVLHDNICPKNIEKGNDPTKALFIRKQMRHEILIPRKRQGHRRYRFEVRATYT